MIASIVIGLILVELVLKIHNPFSFRVRSDKIILYANQKWRIKNTKVSKLDKLIIHTKNSLGFRGDDPPRNLDRYLSILTVGGSTTECFYISDHKTWAYLLGEKLKRHYKNLWLNNAGFNGQSTFGHIILMNDYVVNLHPKVVIFFTGANDIGRDEPCLLDHVTRRDKYISLKDFLAKNSEVFNIGLNIGRAVFGKRSWLKDDAQKDWTRFDHGEVSDADMEKDLSLHRSLYLAGYRMRLITLLQMARQKGIEPVLVTQPSVVGDVIDPSSGVDMSTLRLAEGRSGRSQSRLFELYNDVVRDVAVQNDVFLVDLARELPKDSLYFYDVIHFTNQGQEKVAEIVSTDLKPYLDKKFSAWKKE